MALPWRYQTCITLKGNSPDAVHNACVVEGSGATLLCRSLGTRIVRVHLDVLPLDLFLENGHAYANGTRIRPVNSHCDSKRPTKGYC